MILYTVAFYNMKLGIGIFYNIGLEKYISAKVLFFQNGCFSSEIYLVVHFACFMIFSVCQR